MSGVIARFPEVLGHSGAVGSAPGAGWGRLVPSLLLAVSAFLLSQALRPFQIALAEIVVRRIDGHCVDRLLVATMLRAPLAALDRPETLALLADVHSAFDRVRPSPGDAVAGAVNLIARYGQLLCATIVLAVVCPPAAALLAVTVAVLVRFGTRGSLSSFVEFWKGLADERRKSSYLRSAPIEAGGGKEVRLLNALPWFEARFRAESPDYLRILWIERRRLLFWPYVAMAAFAAVGGGLAFLILAAHASGGQADAFGTALALQAILVPMRFGVYFPESDFQTQYGLLAHQALTDFTAAAGDEATAPADLGGPGETGRATASVSAAAALPAPAPEREVRFEKVTFSYPGTGHRALDGLDLVVPVGRSTAVVGLNGSGKSTFVKLLARVYPPDSGSITVDGVALESTDPAAWRRHLAIVFQDFNHYPLSLAENVGLGAPDRADDTAAIAAALDRAGAGELLEFGLGTPLSLFLSTTRPEDRRTNFEPAECRDWVKQTLVGQWQAWLDALGARIDAGHAGVAPDAGIWTPEHIAFLAQLESRLTALTGALGHEGFSLNRAAGELAGLVADARRFAESESRLASVPAWNAENRTALDLELAAARLLAHCAEPVMPRFAATLRQALGDPAQAPSWPRGTRLVPPGTPIRLTSEAFFVEWEYQRDAVYRDSEPESVR